MISLSRPRKVDSAATAESEPKFPRKPAKVQAAESALRAAREARATVADELSSVIRQRMAAPVGGPTEEHLHAAEAKFAAAENAVHAARIALLAANGRWRPDVVAACREDAAERVARIGAALETIGVELKHMGAWRQFFISNSMAPTPLVANVDHVTGLAGNLSRALEID